MGRVIWFCSGEGGEGKKGIREHKPVRWRHDGAWGRLCAIAISDITLYTGGVSICWQRLPSHFKDNYCSK